MYDENGTGSSVEPLDTVNLQNWGLDEFQNWVYAYIWGQILNDEDDSVLIIPPGLGKSYSVKEIIARTAEDTQYFYATHTRENREERAEEIRKVNRDIIVICLPPADECPIYGNAEEYQDEASNRLRALVNAGLSLKQAHRMVGDALPNHPNGKCSYTCKYPSEEEKRKANVLIGSHHHARAEENVAGRRVILDEFTGGADAHTTVFGQADKGLPIPEAITSIIKSDDQSAINSWKDFLKTSLENKSDQDLIDFLAYLDVISDSNMTICDPNNYIDEGTTGFPHIKVPKLLTIVGLNEPERLGDVLRYETDDAIVLIEPRDDSQDTVVFVEKSNLTNIAKSVTALDGMDKRGRWDLYYGLDKKSPFIDDDVAAYLDVAFDDLRFITPSEKDSLGPRPYNGRYVTPIQDGGLIRLVMAKHGLELDELGIISTKNAFERYEGKGNSDVQIIPGLKSDLIDSRQTMHYGVIRSNRNFQDFDIVTVLGSNHPPDPIIRRECLLRGITPEIDHDADTTYQGRTGEIRDAMLEEDTMQALMRARKADPSDDGSIVYINTDTIPEEYELAFDTWEFDSDLLNSWVRLQAFDALMSLDKKSLVPIEDETVIESSNSVLTYTINETRESDPTITFPMAADTSRSSCNIIVTGFPYYLQNKSGNNRFTLHGFTQKILRNEGNLSQQRIPPTVDHFQEMGLIVKVKMGRGPKPTIWTWRGVDPVLRPRLDPEDFDSKEEYLLAQGACPSLKASMM